MHFWFLCNPPKSDALRVCFTFPQITRKILTKDIFYRLERITEIVSFQQIFSVRKTTTQVCKNINKKAVFLAYSGPLQITDNSYGYLHSTVSS